MFNLTQWKSATAILMALGVTATTATNMAIASPAVAETLVAQSRTTNYRLPVGTTIPVTYDKEKVVVTPDETSELTLTVADDIVRNGVVIVPEGTEVEGQLRPSGRGTRFVAEELVFPNGRRQRINASSGVVTRTEEVRQGANIGSILTGAAVGSAAATLISGITGDRRITALEVLAGTGLGTAGGAIFGRRSATVLVVRPETDLDLRLGSDLVVSSYGNSNYDYDYRPVPRPNPGYDRGI
ncbi:MAG TPA: hypothetical protein V6D28_08120 [Leptolyngbyaceae cyanobacterium]